MSFLDEHREGKETSDDGEIINLCSIGLNRIINYLAEQVVNIDKAKYNLILVNLESFIRNTYQKNIRQQEWTAAISKDTQLFNQYIYEYTKDYTMLSKTPACLIYYLPIYDLESPYLLKTKSEQLLAIREFKETFRHTVLTNSDEDYQIDHMRVVVTNFKDSAFKAPKMILRKIKTIARSTSHRALMLSNAPIDFHIARLIDKLDLIESYTAKIKTWKDFGEKVFKNKYIPFNQYTHIALGDKNHLEQLVKRGKVKKALFKQAEAEKWHTMSETKVLTKLAQYIPQDVLTKHKFY